MPKCQRPYLLVMTTTFPRWKSDTTPPFVFELARRLTPYFRILVLAPHAEGARYCERMDGLIVVRFRYAPLAWQTLAYEGGITAGLKRKPWRMLLIPSLLIFCRLALQHLLDRRRFSVIHAHWLLPLGFLAVRTGLPVLATAHGADVFALKGRIADRLRQYVVSHAAMTTVVSNHLYKRLTDTTGSQNPIELGPMGIDAQFSFKPANNTPRHTSRLIFIGRLVEKKGVHVLIAALPLIARHHPFIHLDVVGDGPELASLMDNLASTGMTQHVTFHGALHNSQIPPMLQAATLAVFPSLISQDGDTEGFGLVLAEAIACECPCVSSDLASFIELAQDCDSVLSFPAGDAHKLAEAIIHALADLPRLQTAAVTSRAIILSRYDWSHVAEGYARRLVRISSASTT